MEVKLAECGSRPDAGIVGERRWSWGQPRHQGQRERTKGRGSVGDWKMEEEQTVVPRLLSYVVGSIHVLPSSRGTWLGDWTQICNFLAPGQGTSPLYASASCL